MSLKPGSSELGDFGTEQSGSGTDAGKVARVGSAFRKTQVANHEVPGLEDSHGLEREKRFTL